MNPALIQLPLLYPFLASPAGKIHVPKIRPAPPPIETLRATARSVEAVVWVFDKEGEQRGNG